MADLKNRTVNKANKIASYTQEKQQEGPLLTGRTDLNEINKRNAEEAKQDRKLIYYVAGILILLIAVVIILVYFFS